MIVVIINLYPDSLAVKKIGRTAWFNYGSIKRNLYKKTAFCWDKWVYKPAWYESVSLWPYIYATFDLVLSALGRDKVTTIK
jgi:hypothetical protein